MNNDRRKAIKKLVERIKTETTAVEDLVNKLKEAIDVSDLKDEVESIKDEEQEYFDNMPEGLQGSEKGELASTAISALEEAISALEEIDLDALDEIVQNIENAIGCLETAGD